MHTLKCSLAKNLHGIANPALYEKCYTGTKYLIEKFQNEIIQCLHQIHDDPDVSLFEKKKFFSQIKNSYGNTALLLSGGASLGVYHIGVVKVLKEQNLLPRIICGSSAGSIFASVIATRTYEDLDDLFNPYFVEYDCFKYKEKSDFQKVARFLKDGYFLDIQHLQKFLRKYIGDDTFEEAYERTGWILNISVSCVHKKDVPRLLNYVTAPNVLIWSAASCSSALPLVFESVELLCKDQNGRIVPYTATDNHRFVDGSMMSDLPKQRISEIFNCNTFIVSQVNPFVLPFLVEDGGGILGTNSSFYKKIKSYFGAEIIHWINQMSSLGLVPSKLGNLLNLMNQNYKGNVTISPNVRVSDILNVLRNPSPDFVKESRIISEQNTYKKISLIRTIFEIEQEIKILHESVESLEIIDEEVGSKCNLETGLLATNECVSFMPYGCPRRLKKSKTIHTDLNLDERLESNSVDNNKEKMTSTSKIINLKIKKRADKNVNQPPMNKMKSNFVKDPKGKLKHHESAGLSVYSDYTDERQEKMQNEIQNRAAHWMNVEKSENDTVD